jgi:hypothetical protein
MAANCTTIFSRSPLPSSGIGWFAAIFIARETERWRNNEDRAKKDCAQTTNPRYRHFAHDWTLPTKSLRRLTAGINEQFLRGFLYFSC